MQRGGEISILAARLRAARRWRLVRIVRRSLFVAAFMLGAYVSLLLEPGPLFAHEARFESIVLHARAPLPPEAAGVARRAHERIARSPFFDPGDRYHVYLCDTPELFSLLSLKPRVGGVAQVYFTGNVFLRPSRIVADRLLGPLGRELPGDRSLTYFVAHEVTHAMVARRLGRLRYHRLAVWQQEGYADYLGKGGDFDFDAALAGFRAGSPALDPARSGLYLRHHLLTTYALDALGLSPFELLARHRSSEPLEAALRGGPP